MYLPIYRMLTSTDLGFIHPQLSHSRLIMDHWWMLFVALCMVTYQLPTANMFVRWQDDQCCTGIYIYIDTWLVMVRKNPPFYSWQTGIDMNLGITY
jgi:hypothetical protein